MLTMKLGTTDPLFLYKP